MIEFQTLAFHVSCLCTCFIEYNDRGITLIALGASQSFSFRVQLQGHFMHFLFYSPRDNGKRILIFTKQGERNEKKRSSPNDTESDVRNSPRIITKRNIMTGVRTHTLTLTLSNSKTYINWLSVNAARVIDFTKGQKSPPIKFCGQIRAVKVRVESVLANCAGLIIVSG